jgi:hypothetical protein
MKHSPCVHSSYGEGQSPGALQVIAAQELAPEPTAVLPEQHPGQMDAGPSTLPPVDDTR